MNSVSLHLRAWDNVFDPGLRLRPFEFVMQRGTPRESRWRWELLVDAKMLGKVTKAHRKIDDGESLGWLGHRRACPITPLCRLIAPLRSRPEIVDIRCIVQREYTLQRIKGTTKEGNSLAFQKQQRATSKPHHKAFIVAWVEREFMEDFRALSISPSSRIDSAKCFQSKDSSESFSITPGLCWAQFHAKNQSKASRAFFFFHLSRQDLPSASLLLNCFALIWEMLDSSRGNSSRRQIT